MGLGGAERNLAARLLEPGRPLASRAAAALLLPPGALLLPGLRGCCPAGAIIMAIVETDESQRHCWVEAFEIRAFDAFLPSPCSHAHQHQTIFTNSWRAAVNHRF